MIVQKFGGTSVADATGFASVADIVDKQQDIGEIIIVVSAMSRVTDQLIAGARAAAEGNAPAYRKLEGDLRRKHLKVVNTLLDDTTEQRTISNFIEQRIEAVGQLYKSIAVLRELTVRASDAVVCFGEQLSASILAAVLRKRGFRAQALSATELIVTDDGFGAATPLMEQTQPRLKHRVKPLIEAGVIPVVTGYIGATEQQEFPTTLGRNGSDYTAAILAAGLNADEVWIWTDVDGILTADPNIVPQARTLRELSYTEATNLARFGAEVLHPKTIRPIIANRIPLRILNSYNPTDPGTLIVEMPNPDRELWPTIVSATGLSLITVSSQDDTLQLQMATRALQRLSETGVNVLMFSQSYSEQSLNLVVREQDQGHCLKVLWSEFIDRSSWTHSEIPTSLSPVTTPKFQKTGNGCSLGTKEKVATVSVIGVPGWDKPGIASHVFAALGKHGVRVIAVAQAATEDSVSFCIPGDKVSEIVRFLHRELGLERMFPRGKTRKSFPNRTFSCFLCICSH
jgi:aspartate kinase